MVQPNSGDILAMVARSVTVRLSKPSPKSSTNLPTTALSLNTLVMDNTISVAVQNSGILPTRFTQISSEYVKEICSPKIATVDFIPPDSQTPAPIPLPIGVCEPVATKV